MTAAATAPDTESWRDRPAAQQPDWPDPAALDAVTAELAGLPPLVFAGECDQLRDRLAAVARGEAFLLQGGDCAETFAGATAEDVRAKLQTLLQMAVVLTYGGQRAGGQDRPDGRPVRQAPVAADRDPRRRRAARLPRRRGQRPGLHRRGPHARPRPAAARLPLRRGRR